MTLNELKYIVAVGRERHFGRAAESCFVSQPTLSVAVKKLEEELGVSLFERGSGEVGITPIGQQILLQAQRVLEDIGAIKEIARQGRDQLSGHLRLGAIYTIAPYLLPHLVPLLTELAPKMPLVIEEHFTATLRERLKSGELDVIIIALPFEESGILTALLYEEPFVVVLPSGHPLTRQEGISADDLAREDLLLLGVGHCFREQVLEACPQCRQLTSDANGVHRSIEGGSLETIRYMVASGIGVTVLPCSAVGADRFSERLLCIRRFAGPPPSRTVAIAWRKSFPRVQVIQILRQAIAVAHSSCVRALIESSPASEGRDPLL